MNEQSDKVKLVKFVVEGVVSVCTGTVVAAVLERALPAPLGRVGKLVWMVGVLAITYYVANEVVQYTDEVINEILCIETDEKFISIGFIPFIM